MTERSRLEKEEMVRLRPEAAKSCESKGRLIQEPACPWRTDFQRDRDRIVHAKAFRRLGHKTQVFLAPMGDHYRTRLTHTLEVAQVARTIARALMLNEDLAEAIALGHDLGHTPFGHAGEAALDSLLPGGFRHYEQSLRVVDLLERTEHEYMGLNLTWEVRDGILRHTGEELPSTWEGRAVRLSDRITYLNHDIDDAMRGGIITHRDLPGEISAVIGDSYAKRLTNWIADIIEHSRDAGEICQGAAMAEATEELRSFLFERVYIGSAAKKEEAKVSVMLTALFEHLVNHAGDMPEQGLAAEEPARRAADYIAGMTDRFAISEFNRLFVPMCWPV